MKTWIILLIFIALWMASLPSFGYEIPKVDYPVTGIFIQHERLVLVFQDEVQWSVPVDQKCMEKETTKHTLYMGLYCARWTEIRYER